MESNIINLTRINNDVNGNPRYVAHFLNCAPNSIRHNYDIDLNDKYRLTLNLMKKIGGKKFHNKQYGGGIVFQSYNTSTLIEEINKLREVN